MKKDFDCFEKKPIISTIMLLYYLFKDFIRR